MKYPILQAHRGVSAEYPENSMRAFKAAVEQGYGAIELDPAVTKDGVVVLLHDRTVNRTARNNDGTEIEGDVEISSITYAESQKYDIGIRHSKAFAGERIPKLSDVLSLIEGRDVFLKIDRKYESFTDEQRQALFDVVNASSAHVGFNVSTPEIVSLVLANVPDCEIHYDGVSTYDAPITEELVMAMRAVVPRERLTVWLPYKTKNTLWVKTGYVTEAQCALMKGLAKVGIWNLSDPADYELVAGWGADIVETNGEIKPIGH